MEQDLSMMYSVQTHCIIMFGLLYIRTLDFFVQTTLKVKQQLAVSHLATMGGSVVPASIWCYRTILAQE